MSKTDARPPVVLVSNRLPIGVSVEGDEVRVTMSAGGLATAVSSVHRAHPWKWHGTLGVTEHGKHGEHNERVAAALAERGLAEIPVPPAQYADYYEGFANGVLWPLLHYFVDKVQLDSTQSWNAYRAVNDRFARAVAESAPRDALVWVHDYQLFLVPERLRALRPDLKIGWFLHVPFPSHEVFRVLPWREDLLRGVMGADLVGFHTESYGHHFAVTAAQVLGADLDHDELRWDGRSVRVGAFPISIDLERWRVGARTDAAAERVSALRATAAGRKIILGVDRLDYSKGIPRRLLAIERLLQRYPALADRVQFIQVAVPSRENIDAYAEYRRTVDAIVGRINGTHGTPGNVPIHMLHKGLDFDELCALYTAADVMLVTPLRDGMNLVAMEFCAAQSSPAGALVLSEFAGAADLLPDALIVNPYDIDAVADAVAAALTMSDEERDARMQRLVAAIEANPLERWSRRFLDALEQHEPAVTTHAPPPAIAPDARVEWVLDLDGTLVPLADKPDRAIVDDAVRGLLRELSATHGQRVHIVSGRPAEWLDEQLGGLDVALYAEHGARSKARGAASWNDHVDGDAGFKARARAVIADVVGDLESAFIEEKRWSIAWHYRRVRAEIVAERLGELRARLDQLAQQEGLALIEGTKVLELRPRSVSKGSAIAAIHARGEGARLVVIGDDTTDESMFREANHVDPASVTIRVGNGPSEARFHADGVRAVQEYLRAATASNRSEAR